MAERVSVMYAGAVVEQASSVSIFQNPLHPYTRALLQAVSPRKAGEFEEIPGGVPDMITPPSGCRFHPRCSEALPCCQEDNPVLEETIQDHWVACVRVSGQARGERRE